MNQEKPQLSLRSIELLQYKNYLQTKFEFEAQIVGIHGSNGVGKTNLLDAMYYLSFARSYFFKSDIHNVYHGREGFRIDGRFDAFGEDQKVSCVLRETGKKEIMLNDQLYQRLSEHIGKFPCVIITPDDARMITEGSDERRRYTDAILCQLDTQYLQQLIDYNRLIQQRNSHLKALADRSTNDKNLLDVYDAQLLRSGAYIFVKRQDFFREILPLIAMIYTGIAGLPEPVTLEYTSDLLQASFAEILHRSRDRDLLLQRTNAGVHKDDIDLRLHGQPFKGIASQGQRKSLLFAMKLAEFEILKKHKGFAPLLLLDDVFEKLDAGRMHQLLTRVCGSGMGQLFLTDTHAPRIRTHLDDLSMDYQLVGL